MTKKWSDGIFSEMCLVIIQEQYLLTLFYMSPFGRKTQFKMASTCTNYYAKNGISSPIIMQIGNAIYGFVCLEGQGI